MIPDPVVPVYQGSMRRGFKRARVAGIVASAMSLVSVFAPVDAAVVKILSSEKASDITGADADDDLNEFYRDLGATSSIHSGVLTSVDLADVDLLVIMLPDDAFTANEISAIDDFRIGGGDLLAMGEQHGFAPTENGYLNDLLIGLGSAMSLATNSIDSGFRDTVPAQIVDQPGITDGVALINYGNVNSILGFDPALRIFLTSSLASVWGAYEVAGRSRLTLLADVNVISNLEDTAANDNHVFFANLVDIGILNTKVKILTSTLAGSIADGDGDNDLNEFYRSKGVSSSLWSTALTAEALAGAVLLVAMIPDDAFSAAEITAMDDFLNAGHRLLFLGEQDGFAAVENAHINAALSALGSTMSLDSVSLDTSGLQDTIPSQILSHPFTQDVLLLNYGNVNSISGAPSSDGVNGPMFLTKNLVSVWGAAQERSIAGDIVLVADVNLISNVEDEAGNDNHVFFLNLVPACIDDDSDGYCGASDCDDANPECSVDCGDADLDGICGSQDCDDTTPSIGTTEFPETLLASSPSTMTWDSARDVRWRKGNLGDLRGSGNYDATAVGSSWSASSLDISSDLPASGAGVYYLVREQGCGSWQSPLDAQPGRDADLPLP